MLGALAGLVLGFAISIPPTGPVALLATRRVLQGEPVRAFWLGLGTAVADQPYVWAGALGYGWLVEQVPWVGALFDAAGASLLVYLGIELLRMQEDPPPPRAQAWGDLATGFVLGIANPTRLLTWTIAASLALGAAEAAQVALSVPAYALSVGVGEVLWWATLVVLWRRFGERASTRIRRWLLRSMAVLGFVVAATLAVRVARVLLDAVG